jgi:UDP-N-acetylglucosamine--N-acetylmuramyl-(pentapeptide) pyrophosphoryl-undecaprenol N-acetylglucosamine transferase
MFQRRAVFRLDSRAPISRRQSEDSFRIFSGYASRSIPDQAGLRVLMAAGGTGGHLFPALAVCDELRARAVRRGPWDSGCTIQFLGTTRDLDSRVVERAGFPFSPITGAGLKGVKGWRKVENLALLPQSAWQACAVLRRFRPNIVVGMGGYIAGPAVLTAALSGIPTLLIEPNTVPGLTNRILRWFVRLAAVGFEETASFYGAKARVTGHPVRKAFFSVPPKMHAPPFTVLVFGGSQGSSAINQCIMGALPYFRPAVLPVRLIHQTGQRDYEVVRQAYAAHGVEGDIYPFIDNMPEAFARADLIVCRSGATTVAELAAAGRAALLIPLPGSADEHQLQNARALERVGGARVIEQSELSPGRLAQEVAELLNSGEQLAEMERRVRSLARPDAAERIADLIEQLALGGQVSMIPPR